MWQRFHGGPGRHAGATTEPGTELRRSLGITIIGGAGLSPRFDALRHAVIYLLIGDAAAAGDGTDCRVRGVDRRLSELAATRIAGP
jgi:hypothetical protein